MIKMAKQLRVYNEGVLYIPYDCQRNYVNHIINYTPLENIYFF